MATITEDYKEKLKEALNSDNTDYEVVRWIEKNFPELKESEDEKVKRILLSISSKMSSHLRDIFTEEEFQCFDAWSYAWLEKQGEHANFLNKIQIGDKVTRNRDGVLVNLSQLKRVAKKDEKQGKQKPAEWSEEDELSCFESALFTAFSDAWQEYLNGEEVNVKQWAKEHSKEILEAAKEELKEQKLAWSEEDEDIIRLSIENLTELEDRYGKEYGRVGDCIDWLKSLKDRVQPKQEWSEEEIETCAREAEDNNCIILAKHIRQLKSLRPQNTWKPSDEQMKALESIFAKHGAYNDDLLSLISDLKKLKE